VIFLALLVIEYLVIPRLVVAGHSLDLVTKVNVVWLVTAVILEAASLFCYAILTKALLPREAPSLLTIFRITLATTAVAHVLPGGNAGSATLGYRLFTGFGVSGPDTGFAMATEGLGSAVVLNVLLWCSLVISIPFAGVHRIYAIAALVSMLALLAVAALIYTFTRGEEGARRLVTGLGQHLPFVNAQRVNSTIGGIGERLRDLWRERDQLRRAIVWAQLNWLLDAACLFAFLASLHRYVNPVELLTAYGIANLLAVLPITPGGLGFVEAVAIGLITSFGVPGTVATLAVFGWRFVNFWLPIPVGAGCYISLRVRHGEGMRARRRALSEMVQPGPGPGPGQPGPGQRGGDPGAGPVGST
jgi:hypothetical protein